LYQLIAGRRFYLKESRADLEELHIAHSAVLPFNPCHISLCRSQSGSATIGRSVRSVMGSRSLVTGGIARIASWIAGASSVRLTI